MRRFFPLLALALLIVPAQAQRKTEDGQAEFSKACKFTLAPADGYQREVWVALAATDVAPKALLGSMGRCFAPTSSLAVLHEGFGSPTSARPGAGLPADAEEELLARKALVAGYEAALEKLGVTRATRRYTRVSVLAFYEAGVRAWNMALRDEVDADQFVLVDPPVHDLAAANSGVKPRGIDIILHPRSTAEGQDEEARLLDLLGPWAVNARIMHSFRREGGLEAKVAEIWGALRGYSVAAPDGTRVNLEALINKLEGYDVVFLGELHGNPGAHLLQHDVVKALHGRWKHWALATEQFERDAQKAVDAYFQGARRGRVETAEEKADAEREFMKGARPWPNHADYRPMVEFCRERGIDLIAGNIPRRLAARVNKEGPEVLAQFSAEDKSYSATKIVAHEGAYRDNFFKVMGSSTSAKRDEAYERLDRMYAAQCIKDDTMAESVLAWLEKNKGARVVHINGAFHSAQGLGIPEKLKLINPKLKIAVVTCVESAVPSVESVDAEDARGNDFIVFVPASRPTRKLKGGDTGDTMPGAHR